MDAEKIIAEMEWLELLFKLPDNRALPLSDWKISNQMHDGGRLQ